MQTPAFGTIVHTSLVSASVFYLMKRAWGPASDLAVKTPLRPPTLHVVEPGSSCSSASNAASCSCTPWEVGDDGSSSRFTSVRVGDPG